MARKKRQGFLAIGKQQFFGFNMLTRSQVGLDRGVAKAAFIVQRDVKKSLNLPGPSPSGRKQKGKRRRTGDVTKKGDVVRPSKPGEPPRYRSRDLLNSIQAERVRFGLWRVGSPLIYAAALEFGYDFGDRYLNERPYLRPAIKRNRGRMYQAIMREVKKAKRGR